MKAKISNNQKTDIFPKGLTHGFGLKMAIFPTFFLGSIGQGNVVYDILERKNVFLGYKKKKFKKWKTRHFFKGVYPWFWSKNGHFYNSFFSAIQARKMFFIIFQNENTPFQAIKTKTSKSRKIDIFPRGLNHGFGPKMAIFAPFFLGNIGQENVFFDILDRKTSFQNIKTKSSKSQKIDIFPKGLTHCFGPKMAIFPTFYFRQYRPGKRSFMIFQNEKRLSRL